MKRNRWIVRPFLCAVAIGLAAGWGCSRPEVEVMLADLDLERHGLAFEPVEVVTGLGERQTLLTGFLLGGSVAELVVVNIDDDNRRRLRIFAFDAGTWQPKHEARLRPAVAFIDVASIDGRDRLITYEPGRLSWFDPESASEKELVALSSSFDPPRRDEIPHVDVTRDVNGDGRDDLVVPGVVGFWILVQGERGAFADPVQVGPSPDLSRILGADGYRYDPWSQSRVHELDYDQDGRSDLVFWDEDHFEVHTQDEHGLFAAVPESFTTEVAFDSDELSFLTSGDKAGKVLHSLVDWNGDGIADLVLYSLEGKRISRKRSSYEVHFGAPTPAGGTVFAEEVGAVLSSKGRIQLGLERHDFDGDGRVDLMLTTIDIKFLEYSLWKRIKGAMGDDVWLELEFYRSEEGHYPDEPSAIHRIALDGPPSNSERGWVPMDFVLRGGTHERKQAYEGYPVAFNSTLLLGDVTGDGRMDLLIADHPRIMVVFVGVPGPDLFARRPQEIGIAIPNDEETTWLVDLDRDGKQDILMHYTFTLRDGHGGRKRPPGTEPQRVMMLMAQ